VGDAGIPLGSADRGVDNVLDAGCASCIRQRFALPFFNVYAQVWRLHTVNAIHPTQSQIERSPVIQTTLNHLGSGLS
jgi:hypothetical protein